MDLSSGAIRYLGFDDFLAAVYVPPDAPDPRRLPLVIFIGHPVEAAAGRALAWLGEVGRQMQRRAILVRAGVVDDHAQICEVDDVSDPATYARAVVRMGALHERLDEEGWSRPRRTIYTGYAFEGVYAWMLAYAFPERCSQIVALSASCHPPQIQDLLDRAAQVPATVVRGERDPAFRHKGLLSLERETGRRLQEAHPESRWILKKGLSHRDVFALWPGLLDRAVARAAHAPAVAARETLW